MQQQEALTIVSKPFPEKKKKKKVTHGLLVNSTKGALELCLFLLLKITFATVIRR